MASLEMRACPFCGSYETSLTANYNPRIHVWFVRGKCDDCGALGQVSSGKDNPEAADWDNRACRRALEYWNTRKRPRK